MNHLTPMMRQYQEIKQQHSEMLVFFRLGDFYEMFYEDAVLASRELEITLTSRNTDHSGHPIPMCGVPHHAVNTYLVRLIKKGYKVALCEQVEDPRLAKGVVRREVTRIVTPGTVLEEGILNSKENNYVASLLERKACLGAAFLDISTGEFWLTEFSGEEAWSQLQPELSHFQPREVVIPEAEALRLTPRLSEEVRVGAVRTTQADWTFNLDYSKQVLLKHFQVATLEGFGLKGQHAAISAAGALLHYVKQTQKSCLTHVTSLKLFEPDRYLKLDKSTVDNLELMRGLDGHKRWTLLVTLDQTKTPMGARLLRTRMLHPSLDLKEIEQRLDAVEEVQDSVLGMSRLAKILKSIPDLERLLSRVTVGTAHARDLILLRESLQRLPELTKLLANYRSEILRPELDLLSDVVQLLKHAVTDDAPISLSDGGVIRKGFNSELDELREIASSGKSFIACLETQERQRTGIISLKVKYNKVFGYFIEVTKTHLDSVPDDYVRKQTLVNSERFITAELKEYEEKVLGAEERIFELERELFVEVRRQVGQQAGRIGQVARSIACLDVLLALAEAAKKNHYTRPVMDESTDLVIRGGRHPVLELQGNQPFVPNDLECNTSTDQLLILTGPNMGGKSTYLRQNALIVILAQIGSFVPADEARIGLVDRIYTRVGASDNLSRGRSTFMVEMIETAHILNTATPRSLILLDEVGRGTATFDGLSIAWSVAEYLLMESTHKARTLFATHYQELTQLDRLYPGAKNYCVCVRESDSDIIFFHQVKAGVANKSYGIEVARLAGLPTSVLARARQILTRLEKKELDVSGRPHTRSARGAREELQKTFF